MTVHKLRDGDSRILVDSPVKSVRSEKEGLYEIDFWLVSSGSAIEGAGFTIRGSRVTNFLTWSDGRHIDPNRTSLPPGAVTVYDEEDNPHIVHDLCIRGMKLSEDDAMRIISAWKEVFGYYLRSRYASTPKTYTFAEAKAKGWLKPIYDLIDHGFKSPFAGLVTEEEVSRKDLA